MNRTAKPSLRVVGFLIALTALGVMLFSALPAFAVDFPIYKVIDDLPYSDTGILEDTPDKYLVPDYADHERSFVAYEVNLEAGVRYMLELQKVADGESGIDPVLFVLDSNGDCIACNDDDFSVGDFGSGLVLKAPYGGTFYICASKWAEGTSGGYDLSVDFASAVGTCASALDNARNVDEIPFLDVEPTLGRMSDYIEDEEGVERYVSAYSTTLEAGKAYFAQMYAQDYTAVVYLFDDGGNLLDVSMAEEPASVTTLYFSAGYSGTYYVVVSGQEDAALGWYTFELGEGRPYDPDKPNLPTEKAVLSNQVAIDGIPSKTTVNLLPSGDKFGHRFVLAYKVRLTAGKAYGFALEGNAKTDPFLYLLDQDGYCLDYDDDSGHERNSLLWFTPEATDDFILLASSYDGDSTGDLTLSAFNPGSISGHVTNKAGEPLQDVYVVAQDFDQKANEACYDPDCWNEVMTDRDGRYTLEWLVPGSFKLMFFDGQGRYKEQAFNGHDDLDDYDLVTVASGAAVSDIDASLSRWGSISGTITDDDGNPVAGAYAKILQYVEEDGYYRDVGWAWTSEEGTYCADFLDAGEYIVFFGNESSANLSGEFYDDKNMIEDASLVVVSLDEDIAGIDAQLSEGAIVSGAITNSDGEPVEDVVFCAALLDQHGNELWEYCSWTNSMGEYYLHSLPSGNYVFSVYSQDGKFVRYQYFDSESHFDNADRIYLEAGTLKIGFDWTLRSAATFGGQVTDEDGVGIPNVHVHAFSPEKNRFGDYDCWGEAYTNEGGYYLFDGLPSGDVLVRFEDSEWNYVIEFYDDAPTIEEAIKVSIVEGENTSNIDAVLQEQKWYSVTFISEDNPFFGGRIHENVAVGDWFNGLPQPTRDGYTFLGWYTAESGGEKLLYGDKLIEDMTYFAQWEKDEDPTFKGDDKKPIPDKKPVPDKKVTPDKKIIYPDTKKKQEQKLIAKAPEAKKSSNAGLKGLKVSKGRLNKKFKAKTTGYSLKLPAKTASVKLTPQLAQKNAKVQVKVGKKWKAVKSYTVKLKRGKTAKVQFRVTAQDGKTKKVYTVKVSRAKK